jgi:hypothetical protein
MKCPHEDCTRNEDCGILDITNKIPEKGPFCSYYLPKKAKDKEHGSAKLHP